MKKSIALLGSLLLLLGFAQTSQAGSVYFDFNGDEAADTALAITAGDVFSARIYAAGADIDPLHTPVAAFDLLAVFAVEVTISNPLLATAGTPVLGPAWTPGILPLEGYNDVAGVSTDPVPALLGTIEFTSTGVGIFDLQLGFPYQQGLNFTGPILEQYDSLIGFQNAQITAAAPVPLPGAFWLFGTGLLGLLGIRRRE